MPDPEPKDTQSQSTPSPAVSLAVSFDLNPIVRGVGLMVPRGVDPATITPPGPTPSDEPPGPHS